MFYWFSGYHECHHADLAVVTITSLLSSLAHPDPALRPWSCLTVMAKYFSHQSLKHVGTCRACRVRRVGHVLGQVTRAVERICVGPLFKRLLPIKEDQLQGHWRILGGIRWDGRRWPLCSDGAVTQRCWTYAAHGTSSALFAPPVF